MQLVSLRNPVLPSYQQRPGCPWPTRCTQSLGSPQQFWFPDMGVGWLPFSWSPFTLNSTPVQCLIHPSRLVGIPRGVSDRNPLQAWGSEEIYWGAEAKWGSPGPGRPPGLLCPSPRCSPPRHDRASPRPSRPPRSCCTRPLGVSRAEESSLSLVPSLQIPGENPDRAPSAQRRFCAHRRAQRGEAVSFTQQRGVRWASPHVWGGAWPLKGAECPQGGSTSFLGAGTASTS